MTYEELVRAWSGVAYDRLPAEEQDRLALDCAREMVAAAGGERAYRWVLGQVLMLPHTELAGGDVPQVVAGAARAVRRATSVADCAHEEHPYDEEWVDLADWIPDALRMLADDRLEWLDNYDKDVWLCPRTVDAFAAMILGVLEPGSAPEAPPLLPFSDRRVIESFTAVLEGYPQAGTDIGWEVACAGQELARSRGEDRAGRVIAAAALTWWRGTAESSDAAYDALVRGFETVLAAIVDPPCSHDEHPALPRWATDAVSLGVHLSSPGGRGVYERHGPGLKNPPPLEPLLCPQFTAAVARDSLARLREMRAEPGADETP
ncbi:hypothetical protein H9Y04_11070 [Streptomyces sp. TRM66268-LWL]|uniref:DUF4259 domain-containing protein n=1 Tax=Streptomyces polyasparticus TaxID=2767826 RepID=A0ABR7SEE2_9ACTN|nr:hypothetical protein [Streptomyces polyasparticus]MBC9713110.1 hypothetical protein [Streptomyces polyasparticus]